MKCHASGRKRWNRWISALLYVLLSARIAVADEVIPQVQCEVDRSVHALTPDERGAIRELNAGLDALVAEYLKRWGPPTKPPESPNINGAAEVDWSQAKRMIYSGLVTAIIQSHALDVWIVSTSGKSYKTRERALDEVLRVAGVVDPCHKFISFISE